MKQIRFTKSLIAVALLSSVTTFSQRALSAEEIKLSIAKSVQENIFSKIKDGFEKETGIKLVFVTPRVSEAYSYFHDVIDGKAEGAAASFAYDVWTEAVKKEKITVPPDITHRIIGRDTMTIITHKNAGVSKLSLDQLASVLNGTATNWKQVGGADTPVTIIAYGTKKAKNAALRKLVLQDKPFGGSVKEIPGEESDVLEAVSKTPGAVSFQTLDVLTDKVSVIETPPIGRPITLVTKGQPSANMQKLIGYIRNKAGGR